MTAMVTAETGYVEAVISDEMVDRWEPGLHWLAAVQHRAEAVLGGPAVVEAVMIERIAPGWHVIFRADLLSRSS